MSCDSHNAKTICNANNVETMYQRRGNASLVALTYYREINHLCSANVEKRDSANERDLL